MSDEVRRYKAERDAVLLAGDVAAFTRWAARHDVVFKDAAQAELVLHKSVTAICTLPHEVRARSKRWLLERGFQPLDDGEV